MSVISHICLVNIFFVICRGTNAMVYEGLPGTSGSFSSPGFPNRYASNGNIVQFIFRVTSNSGTIRLFFTDWYLSKYSKLTIYPNGNYSDENSSTIDFRAERPVVISSGPLLIVIFDTGIGDTTRNYIGFKATYELGMRPRKWFEKQFPTSVGLKVYDFDLDNLIKLEFSSDLLDAIDYVWVIFNPYLMDFGASARFNVDSRSNIYSDDLEVRIGPTSEAKLIRPTYIIGRPVTSGFGFYIRLRMQVLRRLPARFYATFVWITKDEKPFTTNSLTSTTNATWSNSDNSDNSGNNRYAVTVVSFVVPIVIIVIIIVWPILCIIYCCPKCCRTPGDAEEEETPSEERRSTGGNVSNAHVREPTTSVMDLPPSSHDLFVYNNPVFTNPEPPAPPPYSTVVGARGSPDPKDDSPPPYSAIHTLSTRSHSSSFI